MHRAAGIYRMYCSERCSRVWLQACFERSGGPASSDEVDAYTIPRSRTVQAKMAVSYQVGKVLASCKMIVHSMHAAAQKCRLQQKGVCNSIAFAKKRKIKNVKVLGQPSCIGRK